MSDFVHLHVHSDFSLADGACRIDDLLDRAVELKMPAIAITEHGNLFSAVVFHDRARRRGLRPVLGCEVYVAPGDRRMKSGAVGDSATHLVLLAENRAGFHNLIKVVSSGYTEGFYHKPRVDKDLLARHANGLIGLSGCLKGEIATALRAGQEAQASTAAATYRDILGADNFFLEVQDHGIEAQRTVNAGVVGLAKALQLPLVATNDVHYVRREDAKAHDALLCIGAGKSVADAERVRYPGDEYYLKSAAEMAAVFGELPDALANTTRIAERCEVDLGGADHRLPDFEVPPGHTLESYFERVVRDGFEARLPRLKTLAAQGALAHTIDEYERRLTHEIETIARMKYAGYLLITWDFIRYARENGIPVGPRRGAAAGSLVAYCLRITDVDPIAYDLVFERFLATDRLTLPDIDIDFCDRRRGEVIEYATRKYGRDRVAQVVTFGTMKGRAVVRDVARVMDMPHADADRVARAIPPALDMSIARALEASPALRDMEQHDERVAELLATARRLEGMARHASVHAAGVVIAPGPLTELLPLYKSANDEIVSQWGMKDVERLGLLTMQFMGLSTLTLIQDTVDEIARTEGSAPDIDAVPLDDRKTFELFCNGQTYGVFQFEGSGMRDLLRRAKPSRMDDLVALNALYRPGPLKCGMLDDYLARRLGEGAVAYELPQLAPILSDTYGVLAYQEQSMRIAAVVAGFAMPQADVLRRALTGKDPAAIPVQREAFVQGAVNNGVDGAKARSVFDMLERFAACGFNKSHAATYARLAYQTAYLKANYPRHFMAALLTIDAANPDRIALYLGECRDFGIPVLPPDVNASGFACTVEKGGVRFGLGAIKYVGEAAVQSILAIRKDVGRIDSLYTLCEHCDPRLVNKRVLDSLVKAGALDSLLASDGSPGSRRARLAAALDKAIENGERHLRDRDNGQSQLFGAADCVGPSTAAVLPDAPAWTEMQKLAAEKEALGLYISGHPLDRFAKELQAFGARRIADLEPSEAEVWAAGIVSGLRPLRTKKGDRMAVFMLDDLTTSVEVVVFPETFGKHGQLVNPDAVLLVRGKIDKDEESLRMVASELMAVAALKERATREVAIHLAMPPHGRTTFEALAELFSRHRGDRRVSLVLDLKAKQPALKVRADVAQRVRPSEKLVAEVEQICGAGTVELR